MPRPVMLAGAWVLLLLGPVGLCAAAARLLSQGLAMRLDRQGLLWPHLSRETIPWSEFAGFSVAHVLDESNARIINLWLKTPSRWMPDHGIVARLSRWRLPGYGDLSLDLRGTDCSVDRVTEWIETVGGVERR